MTLISPATIFLRSAAALCLAAVILPARALECHVRKSPLTPGDLAMSQGDYAKAETLYADESKSGPEADRLHAALIRAQIHQSKVADAEKNAVAWSTAQPNNPWALVALAEVRWREGRPEDTVRTLDKVRAIDYCNPQAHADSAMFYRFSGLYASANRELTLARTLDPVDPQIEFAWLRLQPPATRLTEITTLLSNATFLSANQINSLAREKQRLFVPPAAGCHLAGSVTSTSIPFRAIQDGPEAHTYWGLEVSFDGKQRRLEIDTGASGLLLTEIRRERPSPRTGAHHQSRRHRRRRRCRLLYRASQEHQDRRPRVPGLRRSGPWHHAQGHECPGRPHRRRCLLELPPYARLPRTHPQARSTTATPRRHAGSNAPSLDTGVSAAFAQPQDAYRDPSMKDWARVLRSGHDLIVPVGLNSTTGPWRLFILDTGSSMDLISPDAAREVGKVDKGSDHGIVGISGEVKNTWTTAP